MDVRADQRQSQTLSPRLQQAVRLLQMSSLDFGLMVRDTLGKNPFLEPDDGADDADAPEAIEVSDGAMDGASFNDEPERVPVEVGDGGLESDRDLWHADAAAGNRQASDGDTSALDLMKAEDSLTMHLHAQLNTMPLGERDLTLAHVVVESLDDDGYLRTPLNELLDCVALDPPATLADMQIALKLVQSLEPAGVGARSVGECLELQLHQIECEEQRAIARTIVGEHLNALATRDTAGLARQLGQAPACIERVCDRIRRLDPRPGWRWGSSHIPYVVPDVIVKKIRGDWSVQLNPAVVPRVKLNQVYVDLFQRHRTSDDSEMGAHLQEARWTVRNVEQRFSTILDVAQAIMKRQRHFLEYGPMAMKPLGLREIADEVGVHESTVSRVTNNKYMATPRGVFELKHFFSRAMVSPNGLACSGTAIRGLIQDLILAESTGEPLSDAEITRQLAQQGLSVSRRTVTKYRQMLHIEAVGRRRRLNA
ncbi:RNA polymerase factor sigma-54 [Hydrogenophaga sp. A37]|uniref:RNA polymerase factor sigma-54 n=1 Tax=Hydrogenophaga sp. A37 TaxID=1945864 RepID=UPI0009876E04|nr:RNA polymerase factor sigma-54 [Hydrogenophaga sp. A37]OOG80929.1 RNA polymerase sigma-54 factor [Hydrogenophaga sp. A37]